jgi:hypothetical protein
VGIKLNVEPSGIFGISLATPIALLKAWFLFSELKQHTWILLIVNVNYACANTVKRDKNPGLTIAVGSYFPFLIGIISIRSISKVATCAHSVAQSQSTLSLA